MRLPIFLPYYPNNKASYTKREAKILKIKKEEMLYIEKHTQEDLSFLEVVLFLVAMCSLFCFFWLEDEKVYVKECTMCTLLSVGLMILFFICFFSRMKKRHKKAKEEFFSANPEYRRLVDSYSK